MRNVTSLYAESAESDMGARRAAPMALQLISLEQGNSFANDLQLTPNKHLQPLKDYIKVFLLLLL